jgi:hypothetical protein
VARHHGQHYCRARALNSPCTYVPMYARSSSRSIHHILCEWMYRYSAAARRSRLHELLLLTVPSVWCRIWIHESLVSDRWW